MPVADSAIEFDTPTRGEESPSHAILSHAHESDSGTSASFLSSCFPFLKPRGGNYAVGPGSSCWVEGQSVTHCPICEVEFGTQHKHVTRRHCRKCGGVFCYTCTYDKALLRSWTDLAWGVNAAKSVHICTSCYESCPPPVDGLRRCRFCHQRVRLAFFEAHHSVCLEEQYSRAQFAPQQLQHFGIGGASAAGLPFHVSYAPASSSSTAAAAADPAGSGVGGSVGGEASPAPSSSALTTAASSPAPSASTAAAAASTLGVCGNGSGVAVRKKALHPFAVAQAAAGEAAIAESLLCNICMGAESNAAIIPCGHTVACVRCLERCDQCPVCRKPIERLLRIYRS